MVHPGVVQSAESSKITCQRLGHSIYEEAIKINVSLPGNVGIPAGTLCWAYTKIDYTPIYEYLLTFTPHLTIVLLADKLHARRFPTSPS